MVRRYHSRTCHLSNMVGITFLIAGTSSHGFGGWACVTRALSSVGILDPGACQARDRLALVASAVNYFQLLCRVAHRRFRALCHLLLCRPPAKHFFATAMIESSNSLTVKAHPVRSNLFVDLLNLKDHP